MSVEPKMGKQQLLRNLQKVYCRIQPSELHGVGVFAIRRIPKGINPLEVPIPTELVALTFADVRPLPPGIRQMIKQYAANQEGRYILPTLGFNLPELEYFVNHSTKPNMIFDDEAGCYRTGRIIARGEELTGDYKRFAPRMPGIK